MSEAVAEKVLRYRRDESGWKICREGVSEELGRKGSRAPRGAGVSQDPRLLLFLLLFGSSILELDCGWDPIEGCFLKKYWACCAPMTWGDSYLSPSLSDLPKVTWLVNGG